MAPLARRSDVADHASALGQLVAHDAPVRRGPLATVVAADTQKAPTPR